MLSLGTIKQCFFLSLCRSPQTAFNRVTLHHPIQAASGQWAVENPLRFFCFCFVFLHCHRHFWAFKFSATLNVCLLDLKKIIPLQRDWIKVICELSQPSVGANHSTAVVIVTAVIRRKGICWSRVEEKKKEKSLKTEYPVEGFCSADTFKFSGSISNDNTDILSCCR